MIIIVTGASHTGKTVLAQRMLEQYNYPYFSIDHLKRGLIRSGHTDLTPEDDDKLVDYLEENNLVDWNEQAVRSAKSYLEFMEFSRKELIFDFFQK